jgi:acyl-CoA reductase-like NAD-dependent aldehyde dehydrogenase
MEEFKIYAAGEFITSKELKIIRNVFSGEDLASCYLAGPDEYEKAIDAALSARPRLYSLSSFERYSILQDIARMLNDRLDYHAELLALECGKPIKYAKGEIERAIQTFVIASEEAKRWPQESLDLDWTPQGRGKRGYIRHFPVGVVAGIAPFNFPLNLAVHKIAPAIAAACPIILKPASSTPLSTLALARLIDRTALPKGALSILPMDRQMADRMIDDPRFALLSFTGSPRVGWDMKARAGKKKVVLELGGNAGVIVTPSANLEQAVGKCLSGAFAYSGQVCIHTQRIYAHESIFDEFSQSMVEKAKSLCFGEPLNPATEISVMIDEANAIRVEAWVDEAIAHGASLLCGGSRQGGYYPPTILTGTMADMKVCSEEVFGPVLIIEPYILYSDAIKSINDTRYGLQAGVFTDSLTEMEEAWREIEAGAVIINDVPTFRVDHMPYGGVKDSGFGREGVRYAMLDMLEPRLMVR